MTGKLTYDFSPKQVFYKGKVRDVYSVEDQIICVASDRISAFDHILPRPIPHKGQVLTQLAAHFLKASQDIVPVWIEACPFPHISVGKCCEPIKIEMVIRGYLVGHAWRTYNSGTRNLCGVDLPEGMKQSDRFPAPIITPATKADEGHDIDISKEDILKQEIVSVDIYTQLEKYTKALFQRGQEMASEVGLILVDTKYEFGLFKGQVYLIDEIHTPDSSRYFYAENYEANQEAGIAQQQLSKEFVREWLMENNFQGLEGQKMPELPDDFVQLVSTRYLDLYEILTGEKLNMINKAADKKEVEKKIKDWLKK